ncbi:unnamed protein product, partial [Coregonus sp. 'balchen']
VNLLKLDRRNGGKINQVHLKVSALTKDIVQPNPVMVTHRGASVNITCFWPTDVNTNVAWFKQTFGQKPLLMTSTLSSGQDFYFNNFTKDFTETKHLSVKRGVDSCNLTISKTRSGDSATYYCGGMEVGKVKFGEGTVLIVKGSIGMSVIQQSVSESVQTGDSVTLNCTIHTETCAGEHSVYWFRHGSGCENSPEAGSPTQSCVYNLPKRNLRLSDAGTYYCAVASCGEILFGNGTKLNIDHVCKEDHVLLVYCLGVALALCVILIIVLGCVLYKMTKKTSLLCRGIDPQSSGPGVPSSYNQDQEDDDTLTSVHYAALNVIHKKPKTQRQRSAMEKDTVYSGIKLIFVIILSCLTTAVILSVVVNVILFVRMKRSRCEHCAAGTPSQQSQYGKPHVNTSDQQLHSDDDGLNYSALKFTDKNRCALNKDVIQPDPVMVTHLGQSVSLTCFCRSQFIGISWFKQTVGQKPLLMASSYYRHPTAFYYNNFTKDFNETKHLSVKRGVDSCNLTISMTESGDSATYYCGAMEVGEFKFGEGTILIVKDSGSNSMSVLQQPVSESVQPGDSVTLNCTIHTETCAGEHSVYWFRHGSGESHPGTIYNNGDRSDQCEKNPEAGSPTQSCVYNLPKRNLSLSDAGTYYCAVASCGEILFGNGTKLDIEARTPSQQSQYWKLNANTSDQQLHGDDDGLNYTALKFTDKKSTNPRRQRREQREQREEDTIYSGTESVCKVGIYWFRHGSGESHPGIIYTRGDRSDQCEKSPEAGSPTQSCVYNLPKRNLSLSDAGTYYCAVTSCGEILFGNWTKLDIVYGCKEDHVLLVYCLGVVLALCVILIIVLDADTLQYAALNVIHKKVKAGRQRSAMERDTVYSG